MRGPGRADAGLGGDPVKRSSGLRCHKPLTRRTPIARTRWTLTPESIEKARQWARKPAKNTGPTRKTRRALTDRSHGICEFPGCDRDAVHDHHIDARGMGGSKRAAINDLSNQLHLCAAHHDYIEAHPAEAYLNGWKRRDGQGPDTPVLTRHGRVVLDNSGGTKPAPDTQSPGAAA